ncbi:hypothetical protein NL482_26035, partial [Klebsiella pneumoniae]|nr:hypothetical protein [Klebsiella pneumoniae]
MNGNIRNRCMAHAALAARELSLSMRSQEFRKNVQAKCFRHDVRPTSAAKRYDASEETRAQPKERWHAKNISQPLRYQKP